MTRGFVALLAAALAVYLPMVLWSLPFLSRLSGGEVMFDLRPTGYGYDDAEQIIAALGDVGRQYYLEVQHRYDSLYPALLAGVLLLAYRGLFSGRVLWVGSAAALAGMVADYLENAAVAVMLRAGPAGLTSEMVAAANIRTLVKSGFGAASMTLLMIGVLAWGWRRWRRPV